MVITSANRYLPYICSIFKQLLQGTVKKCIASLFLFELNKVQAIGYTFLSLRWLTFLFHIQDKTVNGLHH